MKKILLLLLLLTSFASYAYNLGNGSNTIITIYYIYDFESNGIYYNIISEDDKTVEVTYNQYKYTGDIVIPEKVTYSDTEYTVTAIDEGAFCDCPTLTSIKLPESVTSISRCAFLSCTSLTSIKLPSSLTIIDEYAFGECTSLTRLSIPASVTTIDEHAFYKCISLQDIAISDENEGFTSIDGVLYNKDISTLVCCPAGKSGEFRVPSSVTTIGKYAFEECTFLKNIELPSTLTTIGDCAFVGCKFTNIELPTSLSTIGEDAFFHCSSMMSFKIPASVTSIGNGATAYCESLQEILVSEANKCFTSVEGTLYNKDMSTLLCCPAGKSGEFIVPSSVTTICDNAFFVCSLLTRIQIPPSLTKIGEGAFYYCTSMTSIEFPTSLNKIGDWAFYMCKSLLSIEIPSSVNSIGKYTFGNCMSLSSVKFPSKLATIGDNAFSNCKFTNIELPTSLTTIGWSAFSSCNFLTSIVLPSSVTAINHWAFSFCESLKTITSLNLVPPVLDGDVFWNSPIETVYVPNEAVEDYKSSSKWSEYNIYGIDTGVSNIVANNNKNESVDCYTLQGVRVKTIRTAEDVRFLPPGLYIINGKKVVVR